VLTVGSLFSGIGGMDLGLERAGLKVIWQSEIDPYCCKVLKKHWPEVPNYGDIRTIEWERIERPDVICGGYPCQPFSTAGKRRGEQDPRHLWPLMLNAIRHFRPRYAIMENVRGHLSLGFGTVLGELANLGFNAEWQVLPASAFGAPHRRDRVFIVAYPDGERTHRTQIDPTDAQLSTFPNVGERGIALADTDNSRGRTPERGMVFGENALQTWRERQARALNEFGGRGATVADTDGGRREQCEPETEPVSRFGCGGERNNHATQWQVEPDVGRLANGVSNRVDRLRGLGNAVVPHVAEFVGHCIIENSK
jgi:DNA (cytosine-5)-methyltransferase 1